MADDTTSKQNFAAQLAQEMTHADFATLLKHFNGSSCAEESYVVAGWMYSRFPDQSKQLLPLVKDKQLNFSCQAEATATNEEWAAALTAANWMRSSATAETIAHTSESQLHAAAEKIYNENHRLPDGSPIKPKACNVQR